MLFTEPTTLPLLTCHTCKGLGVVGMKKCQTCHGLGIAQKDGEYVYYWGKPITRYHIALRRGEDWLYKFEVLGAIIFSVAFFALFAINIVFLNLDEAIFTTRFWTTPRDGIQLLFWFGIVGISFLLSIVMRHKHDPEEVRKKSAVQRAEQEAVSDIPGSITWEQLRKTNTAHKIDISKSYSRAAKQVLDEAYNAADNHHIAGVSPIHIFYALLSQQDIRSLFIRMGIPANLLQAKVAESFTTQEQEISPIFSERGQQVLFEAYHLAIEARQPFVETTELLLAAVRQSPALQDFLYSLDVDAKKLENIVEWIRVRQKIRRRMQQVKKAATHRNKYGLDRAMTAVATPYLNKFSKDLTMAAVYGHLPPCVAREKEMEGMLRVVESGRQSILLVGDHGVGKMTLMEGLVQRMVEGDVPQRLADKRMVQLSTSALLAGTTVSGAQERLLRMMNEIARAGNIILFINNLHDLVGASAGGEGLDVAETLGQFTSSGQVLLFATTTPIGYNKFILNSQIGKSMSRIDVKEMTADQTIRVLEAKAGTIEYRNNVFFSYNALSATAEYAGRFLHDQRLPESAIEIMSEAASYVRATKGEQQLVKKDAVAHIIHEKTGIPVTSISEDESTKLLRLEEEMHQRVIGQEEAVIAVSAALRRARAEIRSTKRPIANFLFLGSTGVGKTELAKTIADVYFGGEERMIRLDMSEYQDARGVYRMIGEPGQQGTGYLTEAVRQQPFSLVLLDEIEKADPKILDLFLQVFDDGRLTDSVGRVIDFTNTIMIATSNAGTGFIQGEIRKGTAPADVAQQLLKTQLKEYFRPEFLNRFDGIVTFMPLTRDEVKQIAALMLKRVSKDLEKRGVFFQATDAALEVLADHGYDPEFGARPMRRAIQNIVENQLAELILQGKLERKDTVVFDGQKMNIKRP